MSWVVRASDSMPVRDRVSAGTFRFYRDSCHPEPSPACAVSKQKDGHTKGHEREMFQRIAYGTAVILALLSLFLADVLLTKEANVSVGPAIQTVATWRTTPIGSLVRHGSTIPLMFILVGFMAAGELGRFLREKGMRPFFRFARVMVCITLAVPWLSAAGWLGAGVAETEGLMWSIVCVIATTMGAGLLMVLRRDTTDAMRDVGATWFMVLYAGFLPSFGLHLRCSQDIPGAEGAWLLLITVLVCKSSDIGAYFVGSAIGRHKLIPEVSPGKTVEGMCGGLAASAIVAIGFVMLYRWANVRTEDVGTTRQMVSLLLEMTSSFGSPDNHGVASPILRAGLFGLAMSSSGQIGDLIESCFKRDAQIKDSGKIIPKFGGILDLVDSPVFSIPVAWLLLTVLWKVI